MRLTCLVVSVGLHVGLGVICWRTLDAMSIGDVPVMVALVDGPSSTSLEPSAAPAPKTSGPKSRVSAPARRAASRTSVSPDQSRIALEQKIESLRATPEVTAVEETAEAAETAPTALGAGANVPAGGGVSSDVSLIGDGDGSGDGSPAQGGRRKGIGDGDNEDGGGSLIKATPRYESIPTSHYPRLARQNRWEGTVRLRVRVTASGTVESAAIERSSGYAVLDRTALDDVLRWRFIPATRGGVPVASVVSVPVAFRLAE